MDNYKLTLNILLMIAENKQHFGVSFAFDDNSIKLGRTPADFQICYTGYETPLWPLMARRRPRPSVAIICFQFSVKGNTVERKVGR